MIGLFLNEKNVGDCDDETLSMWKQSDSFYCSFNSKYKLEVMGDIDIAQNLKMGGNESIMVERLKRNRYKSNRYA